MIKSIVTRIGAVAAVIGCLTLFMPWYELTQTLSDGVQTWSYTGIGALFTGDFNEGAIWGEYGTFGKYLPLVSALFFFMPIFNFTVSVDESHTAAVFYQVAFSAVIAIVAFVWIQPGENLASMSLEASLCIGPTLVLAMAAVCTVTAFIADRNDDKSMVDQYGYDIEIKPADIKTVRLFCPYCGARLEGDGELCDNCLRVIKEEDRKS